MTTPVTVVFCPRCGSTQAGEGDSSSVPPGYYQMVCPHCWHTAICDHWELKFDWNQSLHLPDGSPFPAFVFPYERATEAMEALGCQGAETSEEEKARVRKVLHRLVQAWTEPHRRYHTLQHLGECLKLLDNPELCQGLAHPAEVEAAIWFHDLVYDTTRHDNEEVSATEAVALLDSIGDIPGESIARIGALIRATRDHVPISDDSAVLLDIDLSILGAPPVRYAEYERQIREEYAWVDEAVYREARRAVLERFRDRPRIFLTSWASEKYEENARRNLCTVTTHL